MSRRRLPIVAIVALILATMQACSAGPDPAQGGAYVPVHGPFYRLEGCNR